MSIKQSISLLIVSALLVLPSSARAGDIDVQTANVRVTVGKDGGINIQSRSPRVIVISSSIVILIYAANIGLNSIVLASTTLGLNKLLFVMVVIATKALKQVALVVAVLKLRVLHLRQCVIE